MVDMIDEVPVALGTGRCLGTQGLTIPKFEPLAAAGGAMWMLGNLMCPYIIQIIGPLGSKLQSKFQSKL